MAGGASGTTSAPSETGSRTTTPQAPSQSPGSGDGPGSESTPVPAGAGVAAVAGTVVVRPGDSLWSIAAAHLPPGARNLQIAAAWPHWYAANAALIGNDPDLVLPGWQLTIPTEFGAPQS